MFENRIERKKRMLEDSEKKKVKRQFGEGSHKKTSIPYNESQKCHKLMSFDEEEEDGASGKKH